MNLQIETLRGLACLLLVAYHVVGADVGLGLQVTDGPVRWINDGMAYLRMPLFTFLSGLVYGLRPFDGSSRSFLSGKMRRLLLPMLVVGTVFAVLQAVTPGTNSSAGPWYLWHVQPIAHFWFVESLFCVFVLVWALERRSWLQTTQGFFVVFALACGLYLSVRGWHWLGIEGAIYLLPYFLGGLAATRFSLRVPLAKPWVKAVLLVCAVGAVVWMGVPVSNPDRRTVWMLLSGLSLCMLCLSFGWANRHLAGLGRHSYAIYLFHVFFTAAARIALDRLQMDAMPIDLVAGVVLGLAGPMALERLASRFKWTAVLLLGKSPRHRAGVAAKPPLLVPAN
jgi:fucose 4-O-acetylase-like acetyltransferase